MEIDLKNEFVTDEKGTTYRVPCYRVVDGKGIEKTEDEMVIRFVRGSKLKDEDVEKREGTLHEHILSVLIEDMKYKNSLVPSRDGSIIIHHLEDAYLRMVNRQIDRIKRNVQGTYKQ